MHTGSLKKWALALTFWLALHHAALRAQIFTAPLKASTTGANPVDFEYRADGTLIANGFDPSANLLTADQGAGTRMLWFPALGAFRAGTALGTEWDQGNLGGASVAFGQGATASGYASFAEGESPLASGEASFAEGENTIAGGEACVAMGSGSKSWGYFSMAFGFFANANGWTAFASGAMTNASGGYSTAMGFWTHADGTAAVATGTGTSASGYDTFTAGSNTTASSYAAFAIGAYNIGGGGGDDPLAWIPTDPLFEIGNGGDGNGHGNPDATGPSDALVVYKNGNVTAQGVITAAPGGDIPMYTGN